MYYCQSRESDPELIIPFILFLFILLVIYMVNETFFAVVLLFFFFTWIFMEFLHCWYALEWQSGRSSRKAFRTYEADDEGPIDEE